MIEENCGRPVKPAVTVVIWSMRLLCRFLVLNVLGSRYEYLVIPELHLALEYRPALVVLPPE